jgi:hypothetical protein
LKLNHNCQLKTKRPETIDEQSSPLLFCSVILPLEA